MDEQSLRALVREEVEAVLTEEARIDSHLKFRRLVERRVGEPLDELFEMTATLIGTTVLVTGGAGFIGSNLAKRCLDEGWEVDIVDDMSNGHMEFVPHGHPVITKDFAHPDVIHEIKQGRYDVVFHLAAVPRVSYSVEHPLETNHTNVSRTLALMDACRDNVRRFVFASSSSVYGGADVLPTHEGIKKNPKSPYALQKSIIEDYLVMYRDLYKLESCALRFFNVFGPNQLGDSPYATAVSAWLTATGPRAATCAMSITWSTHVSGRVYGGARWPQNASTWLAATEPPTETS